MTHPKSKPSLLGQRKKEFTWPVVLKEKGLMKVGDKVDKIGGDYIFQGTIVAVFAKLSGAYRYVVEDDRGILHFFSDKNLQLKEKNENTEC